MNSHQIILAPVQSEKAYAGLERQQYSFKVHADATKTQIRHAVEEVYKVKVAGVRTSHAKPKPKRRGLFKGTKPGYKKAVVELRQGESIQIFEGVH